MPAVRTVSGGVMTGLCDGRALAGDDLWFSDVPAEREEATRICNRCPGRDACLRGALERHEPAGIWAGRSFDPVDETTAALTGEAPAYVRVSVYAPEHGSRARYVSGCGCADCTKANTTFVAERRLALAFEPVKPAAPAVEPPLSLFETPAVTARRKVMA